MTEQLVSMKADVLRAEEKAKAESERAEAAQADKMTAELAQWALDEKIQVIWVKDSLYIIGSWSLVEYLSRCIPLNYFSRLFFFRTTRSDYGNWVL